MGRATLPEHQDIAASQAALFADIVGE